MSDKKKLTLREATEEVRRAGATLKKDADTGEYVVDFGVADPRRSPHSKYYTTDLDDAVATAKHMTRHKPLSQSDKMRRARERAMDVSKGGRIGRMHLALDVARNPYAWPGGYERALVTDDGGILCSECVRKNIGRIRGASPDDGWYTVTQVHTGEVDELVCDHCNRDLFGDEEVA